jgi:uncharacterized protein (TIGR03086 family)
VTIVHEGLTDEQAAMHAEGWNHYVERLQKLATTGDAGQDEWAFAPEHLTPITAAEAALAVIQPVLRNLTPADRPKPTPCTEFTCHELAEHLFGSLTGLGSMAGAEVRNPEEGSLENRIAVMADQAITAWRGRGLDGMVPGPGGQDFPAALAINILSIEFLLHAWDFAQASGQPLSVSDELASYVLGLAEQVVPGARQGGAFAPEQPVADDASAMDRLVAYTGRRPLVTV